MYSPIEDSIHQLASFQKEIMECRQPDELIKKIESYDCQTSKPKMINFFQTFVAAMMARPANAICYLKVLQHFKNPINNLLFSNQNNSNMPQNKFFQKQLLKVGICPNNYQFYNVVDCDEDLTYKDEKALMDNELFDIIQNDDIEKFQIIVSQTNMELNRLICYSENNARKLSGFIVSIAWELPYLIELAAHFGSSKIFKYLWVDNTVNKKLPHLLEHAYSGGNYDIIHLVESIENENFILGNVECVNRAIFHYHNELVNYAIEKYNLSSGHSSFVFNSIVSYNAEAFLILLDESCLCLNLYNSVVKNRYIFAQYYLHVIHKNDHLQADDSYKCLKAALIIYDIDFVRLICNELENLNFLFNVKKNVFLMISYNL